MQAFWGTNLKYAQVPQHVTVVAIVTVVTVVAVVSLVAVVAVVSASFLNGNGWRRGEVDGLKGEKQAGTVDSILSKARNYKHS